MLDVLQSEVEATHPVFENLDTMILGNCKSDKFRGSALDYHLLMWQKEGRGAVVECWEPFDYHSIRDPINQRTTAKGKPFLGVRYVNCLCYGRL